MSLQANSYINPELRHRLHWPCYFTAMQTGVRSAKLQLPSFRETEKGNEKGGAEFSIHSNPHCVDLDPGPCPIHPAS